MSSSPVSNRPLLLASDGMRVATSIRTPATMMTSPANGLIVCNFEVIVSFIVAHRGQSPCEYCPPANMLTVCLPDDYFLAIHNVQALDGLSNTLTVQVEVTFDCAL